MSILHPFKYDRIISSSGSRKRPVFSPRLGRDNILDFSIVSYDDRYAMIQSYAPFTDMSYIINQLLHGDMSAISRGNALYGDFTGMPTNRHELFDIALKAQLEFDKLPKAARDAYKGDWRSWFTDVGSEKWLKSLGFTMPKSDVSKDEPGVIKPEVNDD